MLIAQMSCFCSFCLLVFAANWGCLLMHEEFQDAFAGKPQRLGSQNIWLQGPHHTIHLHREGEENFSTLVERQKRSHDCVRLRKGSWFVMIYPYIGLHLKFANSAPVLQDADIPGSHRQTIGQVAPTV